jgi:hypothetical protein
MIEYLSYRELVDWLSGCEYEFILGICVYPCPRISVIEDDTILGTATAPKGGKGVVKMGYFSGDRS